MLNNKLVLATNGNNWGAYTHELKVGKLIKDTPPLGIKINLKASNLSMLREIANVKQQDSYIKQYQQIILFNNNNQYAESRVNKSFLGKSYRKTIKRFRSLRIISSKYQNRNFFKSFYNRFFFWRIFYKYFFIQLVWRTTYSLGSQFLYRIRTLNLVNKNKLFTSYQLGGEYA